MGDFYGLSTRSLENEFVRVEYLEHAGPRIVRLFLKGIEENLLAEVPDAKLDSPNGAYSMRGGHRLWYAPEIRERTYLPDDEGLVVEASPDGVILVQPVEARTGIRKCIEITLAENKASLSLEHVLSNEGTATIDLAAWAITQLPLGGTAILPWDTHSNDQGLLPDRNLVLWPYSRWDDARVNVDQRRILVQAIKDIKPWKVGCLIRSGWIAYERNRVAIIKRFSSDVRRPHPDMNCNAEVYTRNRFIELETLGPLVHLAPGEKTTHREIWELEEIPQGIDALEEVMRIGSSGPSGLSI